MKLLPPPGPERRRALLLGGAVIILVVAYFTIGPGAPAEAPTTVPPAASLAAGKPAAGVAPGRTGRGNLQPQPLKLAEMEQIPNEPRPTRNIFRYGVPPPPPPPVYVPPPPPQPTVYVPPPPPPIPPVPLKLNTILPHATIPGKWVGYMQEEKPQGAPPGAIFEAIEGEIVDGKYKVHIVTASSVVMSHNDGTGRRTWQLPGK